MTPEELREACEMAGLERQQEDYPSCTDVYYVTPCGTYHFQDCNPALPAYVASLLVAKVREENGVLALPLYIADYCATDEQRIRAAMQVLK